MRGIWSFFRKLYWQVIASPEEYAVHLGVKIGRNCLVSTRFWPSEPYLITIGDNVQITDGVSIHTHGGGNCIRKDHPEFEVFGKVTIEDWAYIGSWSHIIPGVTIGEGALVAAGSVVTKSVPPHSVVGGNPARFICTTQEFYDRNHPKEIGRRLSAEEKRSYLLSLSDDCFLRK